MGGAEKQGQSNQTVQPHKRWQHSCKGLEDGCCRLMGAQEASQLCERGPSPHPFPPGRVAAWQQTAQRGWVVCDVTSLQSGGDPQNQLVWTSTPSLPLSTPALIYGMEKLRSCLHTTLWLIRQRCETNAYKLQWEVTLLWSDASLPLAEIPCIGGSVSKCRSCPSLSSAFAQGLCTQKSTLEPGIKLKSAEATN